MAILYSKNYIKEKEDFEKKGKRKKNPEETWGSRLFFFGLFIEAIAIVYSVGFSVKNSNSKALFEITNIGQALIYFLALISLLVHQTYIKNNLKAVNHIITKKWHLSYKKATEQESNSKEFYCYDFFPANLLFSWSESFLRTLYFILLAVIAGEIPYFLMTGEKIIHELNLFSSGKKEYLMYSSSTKIFLYTCATMCLIVFLWDFVLFISFKKLINLNNNKPDSEKEIIPFSLIKFRYFMLSDALSFGLWFCIISFMQTKNEAWINTGLISLSVTYSVIILVVRSWVMKSVNVSPNK